MITATIDTNVLASAIAGYSHEQSSPGAVLRHLRMGRFYLLLSAHIWEELTRTMTKPYFALNPMAHHIDEILRMIDSKATFVSITAAVHGIATHPEDDLVLATAVSGNADYLVTGDKGLLGVGSYEGVTIVTPGAFLEVLGQELL